MVLGNTMGIKYGTYNVFVATYIDFVLSKANYKSLVGQSNNLIFLKLDFPKIKYRSTGGLGVTNNS